MIVPSRGNFSRDFVSIYTVGNSASFIVNFRSIVVWYVAKRGVVGFSIVRSVRLINIGSYYELSVNRWVYLSLYCKLSRLRDFGEINTGRKKCTVLWKRVNQLGAVTVRVKQKTSEKASKILQIWVDID